MTLHSLLSNALTHYEQRYQGFLGTLTQSRESAAAVVALRVKLQRGADDHVLLREVNYQLLHRIKDPSSLRTELESALEAYRNERRREQAQSVAPRPSARPTRAVAAVKPSIVTAQPSSKAVTKPASVAVPSPASIVGQKSATVVTTKPASVVAPKPASVVASKPASVEQRVSPAYDGIPFRLLQMGAQFDGDQYSKGWWFANLWEEVRLIDFQGLPDRERLEAERDELLALAYEAVFEHDVKPNRDTAAAFNSGKLKPRKHEPENELVRIVLRTLFNYGYEEFAATRQPWHRSAKDAKGYLRDASTLFQKRIFQPPASVGAAAPSDLHDLAPLIAFRGEGRDAATLVAHQGATRKHLKEPLATSLNVHRPWHPFYRNVPCGMYYRRGAQDNCLITVHSIAAAFDEATKFPLLSDRQIYDFDFPEGAVFPSAAAIKAGKGAIAHVTIAGRNTWLVGSETNVHILTIAGNVGDTEQHQIDDKVVNPFRERATGDIALTQYLAVVRIRRVHYGPSWEDGHTVFVQDVHVIHPAAKLAIALTANGDASTAAAALTGRVNAAEAIKQLRRYLGSVRHVHVSRKDRATALVDWQSA